MRLKAILAISLLYSAPFFLSLPASGAIPTRLGPFELGMDYARVMEWLNRNGYEVISGTPASRRALNKNAYLLPSTPTVTVPVLWFGGFESEFGWPAAETARQLVFDENAKLNALQVLLDARGKMNVEMLKALEHRLVSDFDRAYERVSDLEEDKALVDAIEIENFQADVKAWEASDGVGARLGIVLLEEGRKARLVVAIWADDSASPPEKGQRVSSGVSTNSTQDETTLPKIYVSQPSEETKQADTALANEDVVRLAGSGMGDELLIQLIETSSARFTVTPDALVELKKNGLSDRVIAAMLNRANGGH